MLIAYSRWPKVPRSQSARRGQASWKSETQGEPPSSRLEAPLDQRSRDRIQHTPRACARGLRDREQGIDQALGAAGRLQRLRCPSWRQIHDTLFPTRVELPLVKTKVGRSQTAGEATEGRTGAAADPVAVHAANPTARVIGVTPSLPRVSPPGIRGSAGARHPSWGPSTLGSRSLAVRRK